MAASHAAAATKRAGDRLRPKAPANATVGNARAQADSTAATKPPLSVAANTTAPIRCQMDEPSSTKAAQEAAHNTASQVKKANAAGPTPGPGFIRNVATAARTAVMARTIPRTSTASTASNSVLVDIITTMLWHADRQIPAENAHALEQRRAARPWRTVHMRAVTSTSRRWLSVVAGGVVFLVALLSLMAWGCADVGGALSWERCTSAMARLLGRGLGLDSNVNILIPVVSGLVVGIGAWWLVRSGDR